MEILIIGLLILLNALFVLAEYSLVRVRRTRIEQLIEEGNRSARRVNRLISQPADSWPRSRSASRSWASWPPRSPAQASSTTWRSSWHDSGARAGGRLIALLVVTAIVALFTIVFGELVPRAVALAYAERLALVFAAPVDLLGRLLSRWCGC